MSDKREQLLEASIDLFAQEGFWNTPTARIAKHAGVATGTLFNYFPSKEVLIDETYVHLKQELLDAIQQGFPTDQGVRASAFHIWTAYIKWGVAHQARFNLLEQLRLSNLVSPQARKQVDALFEFCLGLIDAGVKEKMFPAEAPGEYLLAMITASIETSIHFAIQQGLKGKRLDRFCESGFAILWKGLAA